MLPLLHLTLFHFGSLTSSVVILNRLEIGAEAFRHRSTGRGSGRTFLFALTLCGSLVLTTSIHREPGSVYANDC
ncbi:unnamed protein product [Pleuronectes platessa]|uniref:Uncharacterized protein n=1 Tax=Pleuronectes platessa TaxID=8262 RepID=A0A9N7VAT6_PLEPL|nr:unnamed protein product [Pleuronectes platessa]